MVFTVLAAADLFGTKLNFEVDFDEVPSMQGLHDKVTAVFAAEASVRRPRHVPVLPFVPHRIQMYDERVELWVDLVSTAQLQDYAQIYVFQRDNAYHKEVQSKIPPPVRPLQFAAAATTSVPPPPSHSPVYDMQLSPQRIEQPVVAAYTPPAPVAAVHPVAVAADPVAASVDLLAASAAAAAAANATASASLAATLAGSPHRDIALAASLAASPLPPVVPAVAPVSAAAAAAAAHATAVAAATASMPPAPMLPTPSPAAAAAAATPAVEATLSEKVMIVFDEIDSSRQRLVTKEEWSAVFTKCELVEYEGDLFVKADANHDGMVSFTEFQRFCELYPTVLDSLYYRLRDYWLVKKQGDSLDVAKKTLDALREKEAEARQEVSRAEEELAAQEEALTQQTLEVGLAQGKERDALAVLEAATQETERCRQAAQTHAAELATVREKEAQEQAAHDATVREVEAAALRRKAAQEETTRSQQRLDDIMKLLEEQKAELEERKEAEVQASADHVSAQATQQAAEASLEAARRDTKLLDDTLQVAEQELQRAQERERECGVAHVQAKEDTAQQIAKQSRDEHELAVRREVVSQKKQSEEAATRTVEAQQSVTNGLQDEQNELLTTCNGTRQEEGPLIAQEVRLRAARDNLDEEEARLRTDHLHFHNNTGRAQLPSPRVVLQSFSQSPAR